MEHTNPVAMAMDVNNLPVLNSVVVARSWHFYISRNKIVKTSENICEDRQDQKQGGPLPTLSDPIHHFCAI